MDNALTNKRIITSGESSLKISTFTHTPVAFGKRWGRVKLVSSKNKGALKIKGSVYVTHWRAQGEE